ncbi:hypothetical protein B0H67DRAFT_596163 [Lasiosphaeris hirsuta]|uniref:Annexin n=1 Tax=Lasiosphaeris hirsuta TaxID=260670 RepID=A0AA40B926_9PEZI|nr:hypothetical protein B0H67DRAFT_596163 [Lasiosphaeris hirsuta]
MPLQVDDSGRRGRSRSPAAAGRVVDAVPYPTSADATYRDPTAYEYERLSKWPSAPPDDDDDDDYYRRPARDEYRAPDRDRDRDRDRDQDRERERELDRDRERARGAAERERANLYLPQKYARKVSAGASDRDSPRDSRDSLREREKERERERERDRDTEKERKERERQRKKDQLDEDLAYGKAPGPPKYTTVAPRDGPPPPASYGYAKPPQWEYARAEEKMEYADVAPARYKPEEKVNYAEVAPARYANTNLNIAPRPSGRSPSPAAPPIKSAMKRGTSPLPPTNRMASLTVNTGHHSAHMGMSLTAAPPSPLLESYHGTYQQLSPMPSPLLLPTASGMSIPEGLSPVGSDDERSKRSRRARFYDPVDDAARLAKALKGEKRAPDLDPLIEILPGLTHEQMMELRVEYKRLVKTSSGSKGINIAKHIRARLKDEDPSFMKACYATALGRWESEAYWANFWYHGDKTRRELLIEALMGRTNDEIRLIKDGFSDKKYGDSLAQCMQTELKEDKFKVAVMMVLEEKRMEEVDSYGRPMEVNGDLVLADVRKLGAVMREKGGETLMITIVTQRSDSHLREVLRVYKERYGGNFAKEALDKSGNLVGEVLAHILNGVINKPYRDAILLNHALMASRRDSLRRELLISRLVRFHWDADHMARVRKEYLDHYGRELKSAVGDATSGELGDFCRELCIRRMPQDTRRIETRVEKGR